MKSSKTIEAVHTHTHTGNQINEELIINNEGINNINVGADASVRPEHKRNTQKGITLLALIITIIVLLILSLVSVRLITKSGIIEKAKLATLKHEIAKYDEELKLYIVAHREEVNKNPINTSGYENMKKYIPSFKKKYEDKLKIINNGLAFFEDNVTEEEKKLLENIGIRSDEMTQIYYLDETNKEQVLEINDSAISETSYTSKNIAKENITKVIIGSSCTKIQKGAFEKCTSLKNVTADTTKELTLSGSCFMNCSSLETFKATNFQFAVERDSQFGNCVQLRSLELGSKEHLLNNVGWWPINGCSNKELVVKIYLKDGVSTGVLETNATVIAYNANGEESKIVLGTKYKGTDISWESLSEFEEIKDVNKITKISTSAFEGCKNLKLKSLPNNIQEIGKSAFKNCSSIQIAEIPSTCIKIGGSAFENCTSLKNVTADTTNELTLSGSCFMNCSSLETFKATNFQFVVERDSQFGNCVQLKNLELGSKEHLLNNVGWYPIIGCSNKELVVKMYLKDGVSAGILEKQENATIILYNANGEESKIIIGTKYKGTDISWESLSEFEEIKDVNKIAKISTSAFEGCKNLKLKSLPNNIQEIGSSAFKNCSSIQISEIPSTCIKIGSNAFINCTSLKNITADTTNELTLSGSCFGSCSNLEAFKATNLKFVGGEYGQFGNCVQLKNLELGSKNHLLSSCGGWPIAGCSNKELVVKVYLKDGVSTGVLEQQKNATIMGYNANGDLIYTREGK